MTSLNFFQICYVSLKVTESKTEGTPDQFILYGLLPFPHSHHLGVFLKGLFWWSIKSKLNGHSSSLISTHK